MRILAIDDDPLSLELMVSTMMAAGFGDVTIAASADAACHLVRAAEQPFGCFLIDIQMPGVDGIDLCAWLRKQPVYRFTPIVMVTAMSAKSFLDRAFAAGATDYVTKPIDVQELGARVRAAERQYSAELKNRRNVAAVRALQAELEESRRVQLDDPVVLKDVEGAIDYLALENYLLRVGRGDLIATSIVTFQVASIERLHRRCSPTLFHDLLSDLADSILGSLTGTTTLLAYAGKGTFVAVVSDGFGLDLEEVEAELNQRAAELWLLDDLGAQLEVSLAAGIPRHMGVMTSGRAAVNELRLAIEESRHGLADSDLIHLPKRRPALGLFGNILRGL